MKTTPIRLGRFVIALFPLALSLGCMPSLLGPRQIERDMAEMATDIDRIHQVNADTQRRLDAALTAMETKSAADTELILQSLAELEQRVGNLQESVGVIRSQIEEIRYRAVGEGNDKVTLRVGRGNEATTVVVEGSKLLLEGQKSLAQGNYASARASFQEFLRVFPTSPRAADAQMSIGDSYFREQQWAQARQAYAAVDEQYLTSPRVPEALMKMALCSEKMGHEDDAVATLEKLIDAYPNWEQIERARDLLARLLKPAPLVPPAPSP